MLSRIALKPALPKNVNTITPLRNYVPITSAMAFKKNLKNKNYGRAPVYFAPTAQDAVYNILANTPSSSGKTKKHVLNLLAQNEPGVLSKLTGVLAGRNYNIESVVAARTEVKDLSRMTIVFNGKDISIEQARRQLEDLVPVWAVLDYTDTKIIERELLLMKVSTLGPEFIQKQFITENEIIEQVNEAPNKTAATILKDTNDHLRAITELTRLFDGKVVDVSSKTVSVELCAKPERITSFMNLCKPFGIVECARSGVMAMPRSPVEDIDAETTEDFEDDDDVIDPTTLPPS